MNILFIGEIVGKAGIFTVKNSLKDLKEIYNIDFIIANGNGTTGGFGIGKNHSVYLKKLGINVITTGECAYYKKDIVQHFPKTPYLLRPANYPPGNPGRGWGIYNLADQKIGIINILGLFGYSRVHLSNPYTYLPELVKKLKQETDSIIVNFHSLTTAEKQTMFHHMDGSVSAILGTGTKSLAADASITAKGTAIISDCGRTGALQSVGGLDPDTEIQKLITQIPERSIDYWNDQHLQGVVINIDANGKSIKIDTINYKCKVSNNEKDSNN
ncbi:MAG: YmdB family metallophosphoesterase [bacterium]|nr:YmdB family metallophosphoesterase [bacterium]